MLQIEKNESNIFRKYADSIEKMFEAMPGDIVLRPRPKPKASN